MSVVTSSWENDSNVFMVAANNIQHGSRELASVLWVAEPSQGGPGASAVSATLVRMYPCSSVPHCVSKEEEEGNWTTPVCDSCFFDGVVAENSHRIRHGCAKSVEEADAFQTEMRQLFYSRHKTLTRGGVGGWGGGQGLKYQALACSPTFWLSTDLDRHLSGNYHRGRNGSITRSSSNHT